MRYSPRSLMLVITATVIPVVIAVAWPTSSSITVATVEATSTKPTGLTTVGNAEMILGRGGLQDRTTPWYELQHLSLSNPTAYDGDGLNIL